ncbi:MAG: DNA alkylation repair protein [Chloroflexi bacterium]|nr:DNA alkylation repair protein [Chloroflexota bacterium]
MSEFPLLKEMIDLPLARQIAGRIQAVYPQFAREEFVAAVDAELHRLELKHRFGLIADKLRAHLPQDYPAAVKILIEILDEDTREFERIEDASFRLLPIPTFVERYGLEHPRQSLDAMYIITRYSSCESAVRPFIMRYPQQTMTRLQAWAKDSNEHVRRLVSEGSRPRLPWAPQLREFIADPTPALALLEILKDDSSLYVRRSVANHLNDISKDHPQVVLDTLKTWRVGASEQRLWLINHALRSLIKKGDPGALAILGYGEPQVELRELKLSPERLLFGDKLRFSFLLHNVGDKAQQLMIDYVMHFVKANGKRAPKVFKLKKGTLKPGDSLSLSKSHAIRPISTRRYYAGLQRLEIQVNGRIVGGADYELVMAGD